MELVKLACFVLFLHSTFLTRADGAPQCGPNMYEYNMTDLGNINCVDSSSPSSYPSNSTSWMLEGNDIPNISTNSLDLSSIIANISAGINTFRCNFTYTTIVVVNSTTNTTVNNITTVLCDLNVTINSLPTLTLSPVSPPTILFPDDSQTVNCTASDGFPPPSIVWMLNSSQVSGNSILDFSSNEIKIGNDKVFVCTASNAAGDTRINITVTVQAMPPTVSLSPAVPTPVFIGNSTTFTCQANSPLVTPVSDISWIFNDSIIIQDTGDTYTIHNVSTSDQGLYTCIASVLNSENATNSTQLNVTSPPPRVSITLNDTSPLTVSQSIELTCVVTPLPFDDGLPHVISWTFPSGSNRSSSPDAVQILSNLQFSDRGEYECSARVGNSIASNYSTTLYIVGLTPGIDLTVEDPNPVRGSRLEFYCNVTDLSDSSTASNITWYFNSTIQLNISGPSLIINSSMLNNTGDYHCNATIASSTPAMSNIIMIVVYQIPEAVTLIFPNDFTGLVVENATGIISCTAVGIPAPNIIWFDEFNRYYSDPLDLSLLNNTATGNFTCRANNTAGNDTNSTFIAIVPATPVLSISTSEMNPVFNREFTLTCDVDSDLPFGRNLNDFMFNWTIEDENTILHRQQSYTFTADQSTNGSVYQCSATVAGSGRGLASGDPLVLQSVPTITNFTLIDTVYIGLTYKVVCEGDGVPTPSTTLVSGEISSGSRTTLLPMFTQGDEGEQSYTCTALNEHGNESETKSFTVIRPRITVNLVANVTRIGEGEPYQLECSVSTNPAIPFIDMTFEIIGNATGIDSPVINDTNSSATVDVAPDENLVSGSSYSFFCTVRIQGGTIVETSPNITVTQTIPIEFPLIYVYAGIAGVVALLSLILIVLVIIAALCCVCGRRRRRDIIPKNPGDYVELETAKAEPTGFTFPILVSKFSETYEMLLEDNQRRLKEQYQQLVSIKAPAEEARKNSNATKNRYPDVLAYDHSRVILSKVQGSDYVNANFMDGFRPKSRYIAAQGPLGPPKYQTTPTASAGPELNTVNDFWRMIWEHNITTIVMLTNLIENNRIKCALYWPEDTHNYGRIRVRLTEESQFCDYIVRKLLIERIQVRSTASAARQVTQFHFIAWPDHGVPLFPISMLQFVKRVRSHINQAGEEDNAPNLIHCSAGVGRTGTLICLDILLQQLAESAQTIDIWKETSRLRHNRNHMIQEYLQFEFVHQAINEHIHFGDTECSSADFPRMISYLNEITEENPYKIGMSRLEVEFKKLHMKVMSNQHRMAMRSENSGKNRFINTMPFDNNCVKLNPIPGVAGSDYINASYIDSDKIHRAFIATQGPLKSTMEDFWRMMIDIGSNIIVMLTENTEDKTEDYFSFSHIHHGPFHVQTVKKHIHNDYVHRELVLRLDDKTEVYNLHHFQLTKLLAPIHSMKDCAKGLLSLITGITVTVQPEEGEERRPPMIVHCGTGNGMTGVFITVCVILQRLEYEDRIDVFNTVKRLRMQRVAMVQTVDQYDLCYRTVMEYLQSSPS